MTAAGARAQQVHQRGERVVPIAGSDGAGQRRAAPGDPHSEGLIMVVDRGTGALLEVRLLDENDAEAVAALIHDLEQQYGIDEWVSDDQRSYSQAIEARRHRLCTAHVKKANRNRIKNLKDEVRSEKMEQDLDELEPLLRPPPPDGAQRAYEISQPYGRARAPGKGRKASPSFKLKPLALESSGKWDRVWQYTNNATERAIGHWLKMRSNSMRGVKVKQNLLPFVYLMAWLRQAGQRLALAALL